MDRLALWLDNPILVKHARSRFRRMQVLPAVAVVMILAMSIVVLGYQYDRLAGGGTYGGLMLLQSVILGVMGASQVAASVGKARETGILDFHRVSPMSPTALTLGFYFGAPIREYLLFLATLPFSLVCVLSGRPSPLGFVQLMVPLVLSAWVMHAIALLNALAGRGKKSGVGGLVGLVLFLIFGGSSLFYGFTRAAVFVDEPHALGFYWFDLPWLAVLALDLAPVIGFFLLASTRKMASERAHLLSKPQALACLGTGAFLLVGGFWKIDFFGYWTLVALYILIGGAIVMTATVTPTLDEFAKGIRKAAKEGRKYPSAWSDRGLNRVVVFCLCGVVLVAPTLIWRAVEEPATWASQRGPVSYSLPIAIGVLVVAYFGLSLQYFQLRFGRRGATVFAFFLFSVWLLPLVFGAISAASAARSWGPGSPPDVRSAALASLSPIFGIATSSGVGGETAGHDAVRAAALVPALVFALLFNNLVTSTRRKIEKETHPEAARPTEAPVKPEPDEMAEPVAML